MLYRQQQYYLKQSICHKLTLAKHHRPIKVCYLYSKAQLIAGLIDYL